MLQQNWFADPKFEMFEDYGDVQSFYDTETKNIYVVMEEYGQKGSNTIQEITPDSEEYVANYEKYKEYTESNSFMSIVRKMCERSSTDCRSLNMKFYARKLMDMVGIPQNAEIFEIPLNWDNQVGITFTVPDYPVAFGLYVGHWNNGTESMQLEIVGVIHKDNDGISISYKEEKSISLDFFSDKNRSKKKYRVHYKTYNTYDVEAENKEQALLIADGLLYEERHKCINQYNDFCMSEQK